MKYSKLFGKTSFGEQGGSELSSHQLLVRGGFIRESTAGRYFFLPLGWRVHEKIKQIIKEEMDKAGALEMIAPTLHPFELWQETNRDSSVGFELMSIKDARGARFALGGTAEEMFVDVVRKFQLSYKDLPFNVYQFSTKFRDELRARGGLLRVREFVMKDAYSFNLGEEDFKAEYERMRNTYSTIFRRVGLSPLVVEADNGYIGGEYCHEFVEESEVGESRFLMTEDASYVAHEDVAVVLKEAKNLDEPLAEIKEVEAERGNSMEDGVKLHGLPLWQQMKSVLYVDEKDRKIMAVIRGDYDVNETKLLHVAKAYHLRAATPDEVREMGSEPGFISPVKIDHKKVLVVADDSIRTVVNMYTGANQKHRDYLNANIDRDWQADLEGDIAMAQAGMKDVRGLALVESKGIEVGNIFQLGYHYSQRMKEAVYVDASGKAVPYYMGCYGIGLGRTLATIVEKHHDDHGIVWPESVAPFTVHLISLKGKEDRGQEVYQYLLDAGVEVLWDDREESPGKKFKDADLIGCPVRLVVSEKTGDRIEWKRRSAQESELLSLDDVSKRLRQLTEKVR